MEVVTTNVSLEQVPAHNRNEQTMAHFLPSGYRLSELHECRVTRLIGNREQVKVHKALLRALARSRYPHYKSVKGTGVNCKKCDKQMHFIVRVSVVVLALRAQCF